MKVYNLQCSNAHRFEGWFSAEEDFVRQKEQALIQCPVCETHQVERMPSAPRLNLAARQPQSQSQSHSQPPSMEQAGAPSPELANELAARWMEAARQVIAQTEDVGQRFAEEARRIHYSEAPARPIRGTASPEEHASLTEEGIEVMMVPLPPALTGPTH